MKSRFSIPVAGICTLLLSMAFQASAISLTVGDTRDLGLINPNHPADPTESAGFVDILLAQPLSSGPTTIGANMYTRTANDPLSGSYPAASFSGVEYTTETSIDLGTGYLYLLAKYDGPNYGSVVWYVGGLTGSIDIPAAAAPTGAGLSHTFLFNPDDGTDIPTPDGGTTMALLGFALVGIDCLRRRMARS